MFQREYWVYLLIIFSIFFIFFPMVSFGSSVANYPFRDEHENLFHLEPGMAEIYGQVVSISAAAVCLDNGVNFQWFQFARQIEIWCNGMPAVWMALKPVAPKAFFEARVILDSHGEAVFISGSYYGQVCVLQSWRCPENFLELQLFLPDSGEICWKVVSDDALLPAGDWLQEEIEIFVLYNRYHDIRAVFLPDG